ncbi:hypothetical protein NC652_005032 [Populus alba x Populus x berolinensis]|nr:hypothetical protein NC652_005032 [Populus alba x Populus x berolinensis]
MCACEDTNHHLWSYLSFMYGARKLCRPRNSGGHHSKNQDYLVSMKGKGKEALQFSSQRQLNNNCCVCGCTAGAWPGLVCHHMLLCTRCLINCS